MDKKEIQDCQIKATSELCLEFEADSKTQQEKIDTLRSMLRIKEIGARKLFDVLTTQIMSLRNYGVSDLSVLGVAEALENELITNLGELEIIADRLSIATHNNDIRDGYSNISNDMIYDVKEMLAEMKETREDADKDNRILQKVEWGNMWERLDSNIKQQIS